MFLGRAHVFRIDLADHFARRAIAARTMLDAAHRDARGERRDEAERMRELRGAERQHDQREREEAFETERLRIAGAQPADRLGRGRAEQAADRGRARDAPQHGQRERAGQRRRPVRRIGHAAQREARQRER